MPFFLIGQSGTVEKFSFHGDRYIGRQGISYCESHVPYIAHLLGDERAVGEVLLVRRAVGKKKPEEMAKQRSIFEDGAKKNGIDGELAMKIFDLVEKFAGYGFNKSHSAAYALVSYQTLWLKAHYPAEFMTAAPLPYNSDKISAT
jgi:DNA polymerase-3 subunit alpha